MALNKNSETGEANVNAAPKKDNLYAQLIKKYVSKQLNQKDSRLTFVKDIDGASTLSSDRLDDIKSFAQSNNDFMWLEITADTISLASLKRESASFLAQVESKKAAIKAAFTSSYKMDSADYTKYLSWAIDNVSTESELSELLDSEKLRHELVLAHFPKGKIPNRNIFSGFLHNFNIESRLEKAPEHQQIAFAHVVEKVRTRNKLDISDAITIFEGDIFSPKEKQLIIESYIPTISIKDALDLEVINGKQAHAIKKKTLESALDMWILGGVDVDNYVGEIQDSEVFISTEWLFASLSSQEKVLEKNIFYKKFVSDFNSLIEKIEQRLAQESIQSPDEMIQSLSWLDSVSGIENFKPGATIIIQQKQKDNAGNMSDVTYFAEIVSLANAGTFILKERGVNVYENAVEGKTSRQTYSQFVDYATKGKDIASIEVLSAEMLKHKIQTWEIQDSNANGRFEDRSSIAQDLKDIQKQIELREDELRKKWIPKSDWDNDSQLSELKKIAEEKVKLRDSIEEKNKASLAAAIDDIDSDGKNFGLDAWTSFVTDEKKGDVYSIQKIDEANQRVILTWLKGEEQPTFKDFIEAFKQKKAQRVSQLNSFDELFAQSDGIYKSWDGFAFENGKIRKKWSKTKVEFDFLAPPAGSDKEMLKIHSIDGNTVTMSFGKVNDIKKPSKTDKKKQEKVGEKFSIERDEYTVPVWVLDHYIRTNKLNPRSLEEGKVQEEEMNNIPKPESKFGFANWFFQGMSIAAVIKWWTTAIEQIKNSLNEGNEEKANAFALKAFGPFLGKNGKTDLQARLEQSQKKAMDEMIDRLKWINSWIATEMIERWLLDKRTPEYMKEAGMFYMFEKYGALCAKQMYKYQGQYFWYQKMWGRIWDSNWVEVHESNNKDPKQNTTEEQLVYMLMKKQTRPGGYNGIQRRSKLDKELKAKRGQWKEEEWDTGLKDGGNERDVKDRLIGGLSEMSSWNYPNAMGWLQTVIDKGGTMKEMNMIPFVMMFSGMAYHFEKDLLDKIKNFSAESRMIMMTRFMSYPGDIDLVNNVIVEISKRLDNQPKFSWIYQEALTIFNQSKDKGVKDKTKQENTIKFYEKYGEELTKILYMLNTGDKDDVNNKMIFFEKDDCSAFGQYYNLMEGYINADGDFWKTEWLMADSFAEKGTSGLDLYRASTHLLELRTWGTWAKHEAGPVMWKEIVHEFEAIPKRQYDSNPVKNRQMQEKLIEMNLRKLLSAITKLYTDTRMLSSYNAPTWHFKQLNRWGIYFDELIGAWADSWSIKEWWNSEIINKFVRQIMDHEITWRDYQRPTVADGKWGYEYVKPWEEQTILWVGDIIQWKTNRIMSSWTWTPPRAANDNDEIEYRDAA